MDKSRKNPVLEFMKLQLKHSPINVPAPEPWLDEQAKSLGNPDAWAEVKIALRGVSPDDGKRIAKLLIHKYYTTCEKLDGVDTELREETKTITDFVIDHPKYQRTPDELGDLEEEIGKLLGI